MRKTLILVAILAFGLIGTAHAAAPKFPTKSIQLVAPYSPGGGSDVTARIFADALKDILPQPVVVSNIIGATGLIGAGQVLSSRPDGHTILWEHGGFTITTATGNVPFRWNDFDVLCVCAMGDNVMIVRNDSPWKNLGDMTKAIRENPGKVRFGASPSAISHVLFLAYKDAVGGDLDARVIPITGDKDRIVSLLGNNSDATTVGLAAAEPYVKSGDIRILGVWNAERHPNYPDVPTMKEVGVDVVAPFLYSVVVPKNVPDSTKKILIESFKKAAEKPSTDEALRKVAVRAHFLDTEEAFKIWNYQGEMFDRLLRANNLIKD